MRSLRSPRRHSQGFTLIELLVTISIVAILAMVAVPSFSRVLASNRISTGVNEFIAAAGLARMEAIRRNTEAGVCAANADGTSCGTDWNNGYLVFYMTKESPPSMEILRSGTFNKKNTVASAAQEIRFNRRGQGIEAAALHYKPQDGAHENLQRCLRLTAAGAVTAAEGACT